MRLLPVWISLLPWVGCASDQDPRRRELAEISAQHASAVVEFERARSDFEHRYRAPEQLDFGQDGTILVDECALEGPVGRERVWVKFTWVNTTDASIDTARITLTLHDPDDGLPGPRETGGHGTDRSQQLDLKLPFSFHFSPESSYSTHFEMPTEGIHLHPNWSWRIRAEAIRRPGRE